MVGLKIRPCSHLLKSEAHSRWKLCYTLNFVTRNLFFLFFPSGTPWTARIWMECHFQGQGSNQLIRKGQGKHGRSSLKRSIMWMPRWVLCEYIIVHTILGGSPVILWISLGGKPKWLPLKFGYHDVMRTSPIGVACTGIQKLIWFPTPVCNGHCTFV